MLSRGLVFRLICLDTLQLGSPVIYTCGPGSSTTRCCAVAGYRNNDVPAGGCLVRGWNYIEDASQPWEVDDDYLHSTICQYYISRAS